MADAYNAINAYSGVTDIQNFSISLADGYVRAEIGANAGTLNLEPKKITFNNVEVGFSVSNGGALDIGGTNNTSGVLGIESGATLSLSYGGGYQGGYGIQDFAAPTFEINGLLQADNIFFDINDAVGASRYNFFPSETIDGNGTLEVLSNGMAEFGADLGSGSLSVILDNGAQAEVRDISAQGLTFDLLGNSSLSLTGLVDNWNAAPTISSSINVLMAGTRVKTQ